MGLVRAALTIVAMVVVAAMVLSGGSAADPRTPLGLDGLPPPFLGTALVGNGGRTEAVDAYGDVVDLRAPGPAGPAAIAVSAARQAAGTVPANAAIVARMPDGHGGSLPLWRADSVRQRYLPGTNVLRTVARLGTARTVVVRRIGGPGAAAADRRWLSRARPLGDGAPRWARAMYRRSLLVLRALTDRRTGAVAAGARDGWAYVWPRDAATVAIAFASAGYQPEAQRVARFLLGLDLDAAARFHGSGAPLPGRAAQGDAAGWVAAAARSAGLTAHVTAGGPGHWQDRADYQEGNSGSYLANAIATTGGIDDKPGASLRSALRIRRMFATPRGLVREAGDPESGLDSTAAWAVRPFPLPALFPAIRQTLRRFMAQPEGRFGIVPSENWTGGEDPWTAPTAWTAWSLAALAREDDDGMDQSHAIARRDRRAALHLMADLRRAVTPLGLLPERVDAHTGMPRSTTPLAWSHALAILTLRELWPGRAGS